MGISRKNPCRLIGRALFATRLLVPGVLFAQNPNGELRVEVRDPSGAAVQQAEGSLQELATGAYRRFETDASGTYTLEKLPFGRYRLEITKEGFATQSSLVDIQ